MIYFTSDTHFGHDNIRTYCNRPFKTVEEMDETIISNWNSKVSGNSLVYHLGDFSWGTPDKYLKRLNGQIILIKGNHDKDLRAFPIVKDYYTLKYAKERIVLFHYPIMYWDCHFHGAWHLFGHVHNNVEIDNGKSLNVGVDCNNFTPLSFEEIKVVMDGKKII